MLGGPCLPHLRLRLRIGRLLLEIFLLVVIVLVVRWKANRGNRGCELGTKRFDIMRRMLLSGFKLSGIIHHLCGIQLRPGKEKNILVCFMNKIFVCVLVILFHYYILFLLRIFRAEYHVLFVIVSLGEIYYFS